MGCSATKNLVIEPVSGGGSGNKNNSVTQLQQNGHDLLNVPRRASTARRASDDPPLESEEPQEEVLEQSVTMNNLVKNQQGMAFDIGFQEEESIIQKHPPKRFQRLEEMQIEPVRSLDKLQEKMDEAEIRRQQILQNRVQSAKMRKILKKQASVNSMTNSDFSINNNNNNDNSNGFLKVPDEYENVD